MKLLYDPHTHTNYSHGDNTIEEMIISAIDKGMSEIHITEHGKNHLYARKLKLKDYGQMKAIIEEMRVKYPQIKIIFGIEANIISTKGDLDFTVEEMELFDEVNMGFHSLCFMKNISSYINIHLWAILGYKLKIKCFQGISRKHCTKAMINALRKYDVNMITHPMSNYRVNIEEVAKVCEETGTILEINNNRSRLNTEHVNLIKHMNVKFAVGSDAHDIRKVGRCENGFKIIKESNLDIKKVVNVEQE